MNLKATLVATLTAGLVATGAHGEGSGNTSSLCIDDAMLVFDGSGSMAAMGHNGLDQPRIVEAREAMRLAMPRVTKVRRVGLVVYGPGKQQSCDNISLRFPPIENAASRIIHEIDVLRPTGETPLTDAVKTAASTLQADGPSGVVVLVTDGKENCGGAVCQLAAELAASAPQIVIHVIGFKVRSAFFNWPGTDDAGYESGRTVARCLADRTGGQYFSTEDTQELVQALQQTLACPVVGYLKP